jgi:Reverse transcriptase (RNA-dependent DNA polymerase)
VFLPTYVDDLLIICKDLVKVNWVKDRLKEEFSVHDLGEVKDFLGCEIKRNRQEQVMYMTCNKKIEEIGKEFGVADTDKYVSTPMGTGFVLSRMPQQVTEAGPKGSGTPWEAGHRISELLGSLLYLANTYRPDIAQVVGVLSRYRGSPTTPYWGGALRVVRYLLSTKSYGLKLGGSDIPLQGFVDANFAGDLDDRKSTTGFVFLVYGGAVSWRSKRQGAVTTSTFSIETLVDYCEAGCSTR